MQIVRVSLFYKNLCKNCYLSCKLYMYVEILTKKIFLQIKL